MSAITTHVLDTTQGRPAAGLSVTLDRLVENGSWQTVATGTTNQDGRIGDLLSNDEPVAAGIYRLTFDTGAYFHVAGLQGFYPIVPIVFELAQPEQHYHVPLLLSPFGYSTYRGS